MFRFGKAIHSYHHDFSWLGEEDQEWKCTAITDHIIIPLARGKLRLCSVKAWFAAADRDLSKCINGSSNSTKLPIEPLHGRNWWTPLSTNPILQSRIGAIPRLHSPFLAPWGSHEDHHRKKTQQYKIHYTTLDWGIVVGLKSFEQWADGEHAHVCCGNMPRWCQHKHKPGHFPCCRKELSIHSDSRSLPGCAKGYSFRGFVLISLGK